jgi:hypothetical protein
MRCVCVCVCVCECVRARGACVFALRKITHHWRREGKPLKKIEDVFWAFGPRLERVADDVIVITKKYLHESERTEF